MTRKKMIRIKATVRKTLTSKCRGNFCSIKKKFSVKESNRQRQLKQRKKGQTKTNVETKSKIPLDIALRTQANMYNKHRLQYLCKYGI